MKKKSDTNDARLRIIDAATKLFAERGYGSTSVREVVAAADVTKPTMYYYFKNKEALFLEIVHFHINTVNELVDLLIESDGSIRDRLQMFIKLYVQGARENPDAVKMMMTVQLPSRDGQPKLDLMSMHMHSVRRLGQMFEEGRDRGELRADIDTEVAVMACIGMANLLATMCSLGMPIPDGAEEQINKIFFDGVSA